MRIRNGDEYQAAELRAQELFDSNDPEEIQELDELVAAILDFEETCSPETWSEDSHSYMPSSLQGDWKALLSKDRD